MKTPKLKINWRRFFSFSNHDKLKTVPNAFADWRNLVVAFVALFIFVAAFYFWLFTYLAERKPVATPMQTAERFSREEIENVAGQINEREQSFRFYLERAPSVVDPAV